MSKKYQIIRMIMENKKNTYLRRSVKLLSNHSCLTFKFIKNRVIDNMIKLSPVYRRVLEALYKLSFSNTSSSRV